jgi:predicted  nucleic acid-binding Zn-ribbon protein
LFYLSHRGDAQAKTGKNVNTKGAYQRKVTELKKKIKQTNNDANDCDKDIRSLQENQKEVSTELEEKQSKVYHLQSSVDETDLNIDRLASERQRVRDIVCSGLRYSHCSTNTSS